MRSSSAPSSRLSMSVWIAPLHIAHFPPNWCFLQSHCVLSCYPGYFAPSRLCMQKQYFFVNYLKYLVWDYYQILMLNVFTQIQCLEKPKSKISILILTRREDFKGSCGYSMVVLQKHFLPPGCVFCYGMQLCPGNMYFFAPGSRIYPLGKGKKQANKQKVFLPKNLWNLALADLYEGWRIYMKSKTSWDPAMLLHFQVLVY